MTPSEIPVNTFEINVILYGIQKTPYTKKETKNRTHKDQYKIRITQHRYPYIPKSIYFYTYLQIIVMDSYLNLVIQCLMKII